MCWQFSSKWTKEATCTQPSFTGMALHLHTIRVDGQEVEAGLLTLVLQHPSSLQGCQGGNLLGQSVCWRCMVTHITAHKPPKNFSLCYMSALYQGDKALDSSSTAKACINRQGGVCSLSCSRWWRTCRLWEFAMSWCWRTGALTSCLG